ncbi:MAG TPA: MFS transporter [Beijerinckiaceae bacterium]|nr:MFS transporter [Beijerinckiaceae bacterium]
MQDAEGTAGAPKIDHRRILGIVLVLLLPVFLGSLDGTIVATALPTIGRDLGDTTDLSWIVTVYLLTSTAAAPLFGKISDIHGRRATMLASQMIFLLGSLGCALSQTIPILILARAVQGAGAGGLITQAMTILGDVSAPKQRARYYTYFSIVYTASGAIGPALGGFFAEHLHWSLIFWLNLPVGIAGLYLTGRSLRGLPRHERRHRLDVQGAVLMVAASVTSMFALDAGGATVSWASPAMLGLVGGSLLLWAAFVARLLRAPEPLIPLRVLRDPIVRAATASNACGWGAMVALNIYLPIYLQIVGGRSPVESGLSLMIVMVTMNMSALTGAQLAARISRYKLFPMAGLLLAASATFILAIRAQTIGPFGFEVLVGLIGLGFGPAAPVTSVALQNAVRLDELGTSIAAMTFARNLFSTMLLAGFGAIIFHALPEEAGAPASAALTPAARASAGAAFELVFVLAAVSFVVAFLSMLVMEERPLAASNKERGG